MARPQTDQDATKDLRPSDKTQETGKGTKIGLLKRRKVFGDFSKVARHNSDGSPPE